MNTNDNMTNGEIVTKGAVGTTASFGAWLVSHVHEINAFLQMGCLALGLMISSVTLVKLFRKRKPKSDHE